MHLGITHGILVWLQSCIIIITPCGGYPDHMQLVTRLANSAQVADLDHGSWKSEAAPVLTGKQHMCILVIGCKVG